MNNKAWIKCYEAERGMFMRVLHLPYGAPMIELCRGLRDKGIEATACHFSDNRYKFQPDICLHLNSYPPNEREEKVTEFFYEAIQTYHIFHFHFGETFFPDKRDLAILKKAGKKMVVHHHGSDVRLLSVAKRFNPYVRVKPEWTEEKINNNLSTLSSYMDHAIVQDPELQEYTSHVYKHTHVIPHAINIREFKPIYPDVNNRSPLVVHAPTSRNLKGTEFILHAVDELKQLGISFQFKLLEGLTYEETKDLLSQSDIVIDQLRIGASGYISSEAMALGKPVICYIREDLTEKYPGEIPVVNATPSTITSVLKKLIQSPDRWVEIGKKGREYIETYHDSRIVANRYLEVYNQL
ncbi:Glycosyltransferase involved in cell wall bisynthesis [Virgibacillus chiguensis]|uniref:Glycosyltransferase involved in cell wall bisynthesis n=2 Tax=Virgibacillus chiguensis TaxID=411959 RepID=A0A1M5QB84_9BACI|nr:Glycosyltransferase involved in cell wall bisynthesis [Virgibacillus chiguensis]